MPPQATPAWQPTAMRFEVHPNAVCQSLPTTCHQCVEVYSCRIPFDGMCLSLRRWPTCNATQHKAARASCTCAAHHAVIGRTPVPSPIAILHLCCYCPVALRAGWLLSSVVDIWRLFSSRFVELWNAEGSKGDLFPEGLVLASQGAASACQEQFLAVLWTDTVAFAGEAGLSVGMGW